LHWGSSAQGVLTSNCHGTIELDLDAKPVTKKGQTMTLPLKKLYDPYRDRCYVLRKKKEEEKKKHNRA